MYMLFQDIRDNGYNYTELFAASVKPKIYLEF